MEEKIDELEKRVADLEEQVQNQPTIKEIINEVANELKDSLKLIISQ